MVGRVAGGTLAGMGRREGATEPEGSRAEVRYEWCLDLASSPEDLWPLVADTDRFDRDAGTPAVERLRDRDAELTNARSAVRQRLFGMTLEYEQEPFEWSYPHRFAVTRRYSRGPIAQLAVEVRLDRVPDGRTRCRYEVRVVPRNLLGRMAIPVQIGQLYQRTFRRTFQLYDDLARRGDAWRSTATSHPPLTSGGRDRLDRAADRLGRGKLADALITLLAEGDDVILSRMRPYAIADAWGARRAEVLDLFLLATREGVVAFRWDVLCPGCGIAKASVDHLVHLPSDVHCDTCNIDYRANFERSVELTFRVTSAVREVAADEYCIGAPMATPHVVAQALVAPGADATIDAALAPGRHRLRAQEAPGAFSFVVGDGGAASALDVVVDGRGWDDGEPIVAPGQPVRVHNESGAEQLVIVDRTPWSDDAVTAAEVTARQQFRDLFASEALRPGQQISVGSMTVVFTDLRSSTELYRRVGDAVAFGHVLDHFDALRGAIAANGGTIVKTIGDAVMAVFDRPARAVDALLAAQDAVAAIRPGGEPLALKAGVHHGPCIAVTLNGRLDYFGTTVNLAARLEGQAGGGVVVLSDEVRNDPEVTALLQDGGSVVCEPMAASLKGFDQPVTIHRLSRVRRPSSS